MAKIEITVYASATGLFTEEECDQDNLTQIKVEEDLVKEWVDRNIWRYGFKSYAEFLDQYTADTSEDLVYWLLDNGYGLDVLGRPAYKYGMRLRPYSIGCQPKEGFLWRENDKTGAYHDIVAYNRPLTKEEISHYSLNPLGKEEGKGDKNTSISFLYRDASNYKKYTTVVAKGEISEGQKMQIQESLEGYDESEGFGYCIPEQLGIKIDRFDEYEVNEDDHCWAELSIYDIETTDAAPTLDVDISELTNRFASIGATGWDDVKYAVIA